MHNDHTWYAYSLGQTISDNINTVTLTLDDLTKDIVFHKHII